MRLASDLKDALLEAYDPEAVILFGSLGRGDADEFSDVDLLLVIETGRDAGDLSEEMARYLDPLAKDKHIIVRTPQEFFRQRDIPGTLVFSAAKDGRVLFSKTGWGQGYGPVDSYETRKQEVIEAEYVRSAQDFVSQAERSLQKGRFFRCRDFARFAAARAMKGLFVKHDRQPPRETDLLELLEKAGELEPDLMSHGVFLGELNAYCPRKTGGVESRRSADMVKRTSEFVEDILARL
jgi:predicted nucleotidyltransferase/HEPN domain-containing protein